MALCFIITYFWDSLFDFSLIFLAHCLGKSNKETHRLEHEARVADKMVVNHADLMRTNPGFRELTRAGVPQKRGTNLYRTVYMYIYHDSVLSFITYFFAFRLDHIMDEYCSIQLYMNLRAFSFLFIVNSWLGQKLYYFLKPTKMYRSILNKKS